MAGAAVIFCTLALVGQLPGLSSRFDEVRVRTWNTEESPGLFPEMAPPDRIVERPLFGISFSGGGSRSATATLGQLRILEALGWIDRAQYLAANSGATWVAVPYTYLPAAFDALRFLGEYLPPEDIHDSALDPKEDDRRSMASAIRHGRLADLDDPSRLLAPRFGDEAYSHLLGKLFLEPFGLADREKFFTLDPKSRERIRRANPRLEQDDFYWVERRRPFLIIVGTLLARQSQAPASQRFLFEVTPLYAGTRRLSKVVKRGRQVWVGGGYIEPLGYDSYAPRKPPEGGLWNVRLKGRKRKGDLPVNLRYRFTLADAMGMSSAAPLVRLTEKGIPNILFPEFRHWAVGRLPGADADELQHGDGGDIDNLAILPLLARGVENILVFVNTRKAFSPATSNPCVSVGTETFVDDLVSLFRPTEKLPLNQVFAGGEAELGKICRAFEERRSAGRPLVYCQTYEVIENSRQSVRPYRPKVCWVYLDRASDWIDRIPDGGGPLTSRLKQRQGKFDDFPHYRTFAEQGAAVDLDIERVIALSSLTAWTLRQSAAHIAEQLSEVGLPVPAGAAGSEPAEGN